jgi:hypothetical protein
MERTFSKEALLRIFSEASVSHPEKKGRNIGINREAEGRGSSSIRKAIS